MAERREAARASTDLGDHRRTTCAQLEDALKRVGMTDAVAGDELSGDLAAEGSTDRRNREVETGPLLDRRGESVEIEVEVASVERGALLVARDSRHADRLRQADQRVRDPELNAARTPDVCLAGAAITRLGLGGGWG